MVFNPIKKREIIKAVVAEFKKINTAIPNINRGGCGIFAYEAYELLKSLGIKVELGVITRNKDLTILKLSNNAAPYETPFAHIVVCVGEKLIDSEGVYKKPSEMKDYSKGYDLAKGMSLELLSDWLRDDGWNRTFNKDKHTPVIKKRLWDLRKNLVALI